MKFMNDGKVDKLKLNNDEIDKLKNLRKKKRTVIQKRKLIEVPFAIYISSADVL